MSVDSLPAIDRLIISHNHLDHCDLKKIQQLAALNKNLHIICNNQVKSFILNEIGDLGTVFRESSQCSVMFVAPHPSVPWKKEQAKNSGVHFKGQFTYPGDSHDYQKTMRILALPLAGNWMSAKEAFENVLNLDIKPEIIIPVHTSILTDRSIKSLETKAKLVFEPHGITYSQLSIGESREF